GTKLKSVVAKHPRSCEYRLSLPPGATLAPFSWYEQLEGKYVPLRHLRAACKSVDHSCSSDKTLDTDHKKPGNTACRRFIWLLPSSCEASCPLQERHRLLRTHGACPR